ncbi:MAG: cyclase family protein [Planctomycetota bacterium]|jgi:kynurenine formamidase
MRWPHALALPVLFSFSVAVLPVAGCATTPASPSSPASLGPPGAHAEWVDLSHDYSAETIYWPTAQTFELKVDSKGMNTKGYWYEANSFTTAEHGGTHIDAPVHFAKSKRTVDQIPIDRLAGPAVVIDVTAKVHTDKDYQARISDLEHFEANHGRIPTGAIVLLRTGFGRYWPDAQKYLGTAERGAAATLRLHFPGLHPSAARWLLENRDIRAVGIDTASIDHGQSRLFHSHRVLFGADVPAFENVANLERLPATGAWVIALPMKIRGGSGGPVRIAARVPR